MRRTIVVAALLMASVGGLLSPAPAWADSVSIGVNIGTSPPPSPVVVLPAPPQLVVVPGTPVYYAPGVSLNFSFYSGRFYTFHNEAWFYSTAYNGPWTFVVLEQVPRPILAVPVAYYRVPPGHWKKNGPPPWAEDARGHKPKK